MDSKSSHSHAMFSKVGFMSDKIFSPGETVEESGIYPVVGPVTVVQGEPFPPTQEKGWGFGTPRLAESTRSDRGTVEIYSPPTLPANRPVFRGNPALVPSDKLPNSRPILAGMKKVVSSDHLPLHRPVFQSDLEIAAMHGDRPVVRLHTSFAPSSSLPENRPILVNETVSSQGLMGYID